MRAEFQVHVAAHPFVARPRAADDCFRDRAARPNGRTTPPTDPDERN
jgi:hypothetical protein